MVCPLRIFFLLHILHEDLERTSSVGFGEKRLKCTCHQACTLGKEPFSHPHLIRFASQSCELTAYSGRGIDDTNHGEMVRARGLAAYVEQDCPGIGLKPRIIAESVRFQQTES